jgi:hypothetical protein
VAVPAPRTWDDGDDPVNLPTHPDLNTDWNDSFNWLLGWTRPFFVGVASAATVLTYNTFVAVPWGVETAKRQITHSTSTNPSRITVPESGRYRGIVYIAANQTTTTAAGKWYTQVLVNGAATPAQYSATPTEDPNMDFMFPFVVTLTAGDYIEVLVNNFVNSAASAVTLRASISRILLYHDV